MSTDRAGLGLDAGDLDRVIATALDEDLGYGPDATTAACVPAGAIATGTVSPRTPGTLAGLPAFLAVLDAVLGADGYEITARRQDADRLAAGEVALAVRAPVAGLLTAERTALNLLCHLSGVATATAAWVAAVAGTGTSIRDSRKTLPGLRALQKYAVRCGGGANHRMGLGDAVLIKDNHVTAAGSDTELEASGRLTLDVARAYAKTGVRYLAVGGLTHSAPALDLGLDLSST